MSPLRLRKRAAGLALGAIVLFLIGTNVQAGMLFVLAALLMGALLVGLVLPFAALRGLRAELIAPAETEQGSPAMVDLLLTNDGRGVRWSVVAADEHLEHAEVFLPVIRPGGRAEVTTVRVPVRRGDHSTKSVHIRSSAPFGVAERRRRLTVDASTLVLPRVDPLGPLPFIDPVPTHESGIHDAPRLGHGPDFLGVREYRPGDPMRHVHWALTARHGQVMVREFEQERTRRLAIVVDTERGDDAARDEGGMTALDRCCTVAASVLEAALAAGHGARLIAGVDGEIDLLARADRDEMMRWLARLTPSGMPLTEVLGRLDAETLRGVGTVLIASPMWPGTHAAAIAGITMDLPVERTVLVSAVAAEDPPIAALETYTWRDGEPLAEAFGEGALA